MTNIVRRVGIAWGGWEFNPQFMSTDAHVWVKGLKFQSLCKVWNISTSDLSPAAIRPHPTRLPASIGCAPLRESSSRSPSWHMKSSMDLRQAISALSHVSPTYRPIQSPIAACCRQQSPGSAYSRLSTVGSRAFPVAGRRDISRIIDHISSPPQDTPVQEVFPPILAGHQLTVFGGPSSSSAT